ncbi:MAG: hypothetical protein Q8L56_11910 [Rhodocyclaceae bacterium]|nr:hypothetical protein [Rhodocyclaceae bacterium]
MQTRNLMLMAVLPVSLLAACAPLTPNLDSHFGDAVNIVKAQQIINPDAAKNPDTVSGVDGVTAASAIKNYNKKAEAPPPTTISNTINIGGGK